MNPNPNEKNVCDRPKCIPCNKNPNQKKRICSKSNVLYNYECDEKEICPDATYDGQSSKNLYTRALGHNYKYDKNHKDSHVRRTAMMFFKLVGVWQYFFSTQDNPLVQWICVSKSNTCGFWTFWTSKLTNFKTRLWTRDTCHVYSEGTCG